MLLVCILLSLALAIRAHRKGHSPWMHLALGALGPLAAVASYQHTRRRRPSRREAALAGERWHAAFGDASSAGPAPPAPLVEDASLLLTCGLAMVLQTVCTLALVMHSTAPSVIYLFTSYFT